MRRDRPDRLRERVREQRPLACQGVEHGAHRQRIAIPLEESATPRLPIFRDNRATTTMASSRHFRKMVLRSLMRRPWLAWRTVRYLIAQSRALRNGPGGSGRP
jgi:hypothetical protein